MSALFIIHFLIIFCCLLLVVAIMLTDIKHFYFIRTKNKEQKMHSSGRKLMMARHSGAEIEVSNNRIHKYSPGTVARPLMATRRINTQANQKKVAQKKYLLKKTKKDEKPNILGFSQQGSISKQKWNIWDKTSLNENEWIIPLKQQPQAMKKSTQRLTYGSKIKELEKLIKGKKQNERKGQDYSNSLKHKSKNRVIVDCDSHINSRQITQDNIRKSTDKSWFDDARPKYQVLHDKLLGSGTFGKVFAGVCNRTGQNVAIKTFENDRSHKCRQIELMEMVKSKFVIRLVDKYITTSQNKEQQKQTVYIVMPKYESSFFQYLKHRNYVVEPGLLKIYLYQIFKGVYHLHEKGICHRDLKPQNVLFSKNKLVICDLGSAKILKKGQPNISYICSRCYRAPQLIFGSTCYSYHIDIWSIGCIILEILNKGPFFIAKDSLHHLIEVMKVMGTPTKKEVLSMNPNYDITSFEDIPIISKKSWEDQLEINDDLLLDLIQKIMVYNPQKRITAEQALKHPYFLQLRDPNFIESMQNKIDCYELINSI